MECEHFINGQCGHAEAVKRYGLNPGRGVHKQCEWNTTGGAWPTINGIGKRLSAQPVPHEQWDELQLMLESQRISGEIGTGDTMKRLTDADPTVSKAMKEMGITPATCGCDATRREWNIKFRYAAP